jgi:hypothetical protein
LLRFELAVSSVCSNAHAKKVNVLKTKDHKRF